MTTRKWLGLSLIGVLLLAVGIPFVVRSSRIARSSAFCDAVEALPRAELEQYASRCDRLILESGGPEGDLRFINDVNVLAQFTLAGRRPYQIVLEKGSVGVKFFKGHWSYSTLAHWDEDFSPNGESIRALKIVHGDSAWRVLYQRPIQSNGENK